MRRQSQRTWRRGRPGEVAPAVAAGIEYAPNHRPSLVLVVVGPGVATAAIRIALTTLDPSRRASVQPYVASGQSPESSIPPSLDQFAAHHLSIFERAYEHGQGHHFGSAINLYV